MSKIKIAIIGLGNCASSLIQGIYYYKSKKPEDAIGLMHWDIGGYKPGDIEVVAAIDIDKRKVGKDVSEAVFAKPNCTYVFYRDIPKMGVKVAMGHILDGVAPHMRHYPEDRTFLIADEKPVDVVKLLEESEAEIALNYLPVGSEEASRFYTECCLKANVAFINCVPVFIASDEGFAHKFSQKSLPVVGDDIKAQIGATITHRTLMKLFKDRGVKIDRTYQLNVGGNTDFLNMLARERLNSKKISKTDAVQSILAQPLLEENIQIGPSDYVPWLKDNKICFLRIEGRMFGDVPMNMEVRLSVEDSPNSAGCVIDAIRCCKLALDRGIGGPLISISAYTMKHPPVQIPDEEAKKMVEEFIHGLRER
ncbi:MAG TPA: inositol-3-phosphate synthase [Candidatus Omnitrophica bacterium]|nr:inositol-3-phosphate synthase [Candidatus Omnitrophota bacterium]